MKRFLTITLLSLSTMATPALAEGQQGHDHSAHAAATRSMIEVTAAAKDAVAAVDRFSVALANGRLDVAGAELHPDVLILESGGAERSAAEYLGGHAKGDAAFLKGAHIQITNRSARVSGDLVWVATESEMHLSKDGKPVTVLSTETMVVQRYGDAWKIVHIHWSSRTKMPGGQHQETSNVSALLNADRFAAAIDADGLRGS